MKPKIRTRNRILPCSILLAVALGAIAQGARYELPGLWEDYMLRPPYVSSQWGDDAVKRETRLANEATQIADADIDFSKYKVVAIVTSVLLPSGDEGVGGIVHGAALPSGRGLRIRTNDGVFVDSVMICWKQHDLRTFAHEFAHMLGLPDLYDTKLMRAGALHSGVWAGNWDLMSSASTRRIRGMTAWSKIRFGWLKKSQVKIVRPGTALTTTVEVIELASDATKAVKIPLGNGSYYRVEARAKLGVDSWLDEGILITLCDDRIGWGEGIVTVVDANPATSRTTPRGLDDATFSLGAGKNAAFFDKQNNISVVITQKQGLLYTIFLGSVSEGESVLKSTSALVQLNYRLVVVVGVASLTIIFWLVVSRKIKNN